MVKLSRSQDKKKKKKDMNVGKGFEGGGKTGVRERLQEVVRLNRMHFMCMKLPMRTPN